MTSEAKAAFINHNTTLFVSFSSTLSKMEYSVDLICFGGDVLDPARKDAVECGGKVLLPPSVLEDLVGGPRLPNPLLFKIENCNNLKFTNVGVLEFVAENRITVVPSWVLHHLELQPGDTVKVSLAPHLPVAKFARFQPKSKEFLNISDPKAVLENSLRKFACLTSGDVLQIDYNNRKYSITVEETKPSSAVNIIECDMEVEFSQPEDYEEPQFEPIQASSNIERSSFIPFAGEGKRLDGKPSVFMCTSPSFRPPSGLPDYDYCPDTLSFFRIPHSKDKTQRALLEE